MPDLESLLARLNRHDINFVIVGGYAAMAHGCTLVTMDIDICIDLAPGNLQRIQEALVDTNPVHRMTPKRLPFRISPDACGGIKNLYLDTDIGQLDCLGEVKGIGGYEDALQVSEEIDLPFGSCRILTLDAIIEAKKAMDRPRDREAVFELEAIRADRGRSGD